MLPMTEFLKLKYLFSATGHIASVLYKHFESWAFYCHSILTAHYSNISVHRDQTSTICGGFQINNNCDTLERA